MKKWHMEGIICASNNRQRRVVFVDRDRMYLAADGYTLQTKRKIPRFELVKKLWHSVLQKN